MSPISNHRVHFDTVADACLKVTDELAASGTTRGLELECKRYALRPIRFAWPEIVVSLLGILFLVGLLFIDQTQIGKIILWRV